MQNSIPALRLVLALILLTAGACAQGFLDLRDSSASDVVRDAEGWRLTSGFHAARQELETMIGRISTEWERRDATYLLMESTFEDQEYEDATGWSSLFLREFPNDRQRSTALFIEGVSAFQTRKLGRAIEALDEFLVTAPDHPKRGAAYFWRAMCKLDRGDWAAAEADLEFCSKDSAASLYHDIALMGWALSLERRGVYGQAIELLTDFLKKFPESSLVPEVKIRLASLRLREGEPEESARILAAVHPSSRERPEYLLIRAEAGLESGSYSRSRSDYQRFAQDYPDNPNERMARFGLGWSSLQEGDKRFAQAVFDSLGRGTDSIAVNALYQSAVLALLEERPYDALARFDSLIERSPYDMEGERAYFQSGMVHYRAKRYREARRFFQLAARLFPESPRRAQSYRMLGESNVALGDFSNAQYAFSQVRRLGTGAELLAPAMMQEGICLYHLGRFKSSWEMFTEYLRTFPRAVRSGEAMIWKGEALYQDYRFAEAERSFSDAMRLFPDNPKRSDAAYGLAWSLFEEKKFAPAASAFERFTSDFRGDSRSLDASLRRADCYFFLGQYDRAKDMYAALEAEKTDSRTVEYAAFQVAMSYIQRGESDRGIEELRRFLARFPASLYNEVVQFNIGWEYFSKERYTEALPELKLVMQKYPDSQLMQRVLFNLGDVYYNLKQYDSARVYYGRVIREYPASLLVNDALSGLQYTYAAQGKPAGALAEIDTILRSQAVSTPKEELVLRKGDILFSQADFAGAIREYQSVLAENPSHAAEAKALHQLGRSYEMENNPERAISYYRKIVDQFSDADVAPAAALSLATAQIKGGQYRDAAGVLGMFERKYPDSPLLTEVKFYHGIALRGLPDTKGAMEIFQALIREHGDEIFSDKSRLEIARILQERHDYAASLDTLTGLVTRRSDDLAAEGLVMIGHNYLAMKRTTDALQAFNDCIRQYTDYPLWVDRARLGLGEAYEKLRDRTRARAAYQEVVTSTVDPALKKEAEQKIRRLR